MADIDVDLTLDATPETRTEPISEDSGTSPLHGEINRAEATTVGNVRCIGRHRGFPAIRSRTLHEGETGRIVAQFRRPNRGLTRHAKSPFAVGHPRPTFVGKAAGAGTKSAAVRVVGLRSGPEPRGYIGRRGRFAPPGALVCWSALQDRMELRLP